MNGLEISKAYWELYGKPMLRSRFPQILDLIAVGLVGPGSECYGYDDKISVDHDFEPGFCLFLPSEDEIDRRTEFLLERAYNTLPTDFMGIARNRFSPAGGSRRGIFRTHAFYEKMTGIPGAPQTWRDWLSLPDYALAEVTNGEVFYDGSGKFTAIREAWKNPSADVQRKKLCGFLFSMSQTGEYNYPRCILRGDIPAARLTANEFVRSCLGAGFWSCNRPVPYYKWSFRALRELPDADALYPLLESILRCQDTEQNISAACGTTLSLLQRKRMLSEEKQDLQRAAFFLNEQIHDLSLRHLDLLAAVSPG